MTFRDDKALVARFESKFEKTDGCWEWAGSKGVRGYGSFKFNETLKAHRFSYLLYVGPIPDGMSVCHKCDNPSCVNPDHLFLGDHFANMRDKMAKGRGNHLVGSSHPRSRLTEDDVRAIRADTRFQVEIAKAFGIKQAQVSEIKRRVAWAHVV